MMESKISALIVDDEKLARNVIKRFVEEYENIFIAAECNSGITAVQQIEALQPDLIFLDIQLPDLDGFQVIKEVELPYCPVYIFITAHNKYAVEAFEANAMDYLLKPFTKERFDKAVKKALDHLSLQKEMKVNNALEKLLKIHSQLYDKDAKPTHLQKVLIKENKKIFMLPLTDVFYIESSGDYIKLHLKNKSHLLNESLSNLEARLDPAQFMRIHRSFIINVDYIKEFIPHFNSEYFIVMQNDAQVKLSRSYKDQFRNIMGKNLL
ncbi:MAG: LytTR family DNA-binding domain-containing protein [Ginsengibacter sp.]